MNWNDFSPPPHPPAPLSNSHTGTPTTAGRGREGVKVLVEKPDANLSVWHGMADRVELIKPKDNAMYDDDDVIFI